MLDITVGEIYTTVILEVRAAPPMKVLPGRATGVFILDENYLIKEYWLHEWNQVMINRVLRASHLSEPVMGLVHRFEKGKHQ